MKIMSGVDIIAIHLAFTGYMTGVIWFVQLVHYPLLGRADAENYAEFHRAHTNRTGWVVVVPMLLELAAAFGLLFTGVSQTMATIGLVLLVFIWAWTGLFQVRQHRQLSEGFDEEIHARLIRTNWPRTIGWTARFMIALILVWG